MLSNFKKWVIYYLIFDVHFEDTVQDCSSNGIHTSEYLKKRAFFKLNSVSNREDNAYSTVMSSQEAQ